MTAKQQQQRDHRNFCSTLDALKWAAAGGPIPLDLSVDLDDGRVRSLYTMTLLEVSEFRRGLIARERARLDANPDLPYTGQGYFTERES